MSESFNYIAFANREYIQGSINTIEMSRGRMFEYTPTDIQKRLENLGSSSIEFLEKLPTFLCSEISQWDGAATMVVKFGVIENTKAGPNEVTTTFRELMNFDEVKFASVEEARNFFGADKFQLYRTHWAVRDGSVQEILTKLRQLKPELVNILVDPREPDLAAAAAEPPARTKNTIGIADSVEAFLKILYDMPSKESTENFFRGHEDAAFELTPALLREWPDRGWPFMANEDRLCKELLIAHYEEFQGDQYCFDRLVRMQHYGLPTRLLDISGNPLIALFFACNSTQERFDTAGEAIIFRVSSDKVKYYDSDTVSCLANLSNLTYAQKNEIDLTLDISAFNKTNIAQKLLHHIKSEKGFFEGRIVPNDLGSIICVKAKQTNTRIKSQSGSFLLFGQGAATLPESGQEGIEIARVTVINKEHILKQLDSININATTVYPSIDRTTVHLRDRCLAEHASGASKTTQ